MGADEERTLVRLNAHRRELIDPKIQEHRGRIVKTTGDGMLVEFASVVDAVRCAVESQRGMAERNAEVPATQRIEFRIGINLGDIIVEADDIFGDGVNVAARLEALAEPGGICVSRTVRNQVRDKLPYQFEDIGEQLVKNIVRPIRVDALTAAAIAATPLTPVQTPAKEPSQQHRTPQKSIIAAGLLAVLAVVAFGGWWLWPRQAVSPKQTGVPATSVGAAPASPAPRLSIVVLPFANLSSDLEQEYFADGVTDDLTTDLSRSIVGDSFVIARTTAFTYKGKAVDVKEIGRELGVRYVLEGSVRRLGEQVQINVQLIDAETGAHIWAERFDTDRTNLAKVQDEIVGRLTRSLHLELVEAVGRRIEQEKPINLDARDYVMRGWAWYFRPASANTYKEAERAFQQAREMDPESVNARVGIAAVLLDKQVAGFSESVQKDIAQAEGLLVEVLERDAHHVRALWSLGWIRGIQNRHDEELILLEQAVALDRNSLGAMIHLGFALMNDRPEAALPYFQRALQLSPRDQNRHWFYNALGEGQFVLGNTAEAINNWRKARAANPRIYLFSLWLAAAYGLRGEIDDARAALAESLKLQPKINSLVQLRAHKPAWARSSPPEWVALRERTYETGLRRAGMPDE
jgi:adenylate cyclase